jgi:hypothetical protein
MFMGVGPFPFFAFFEPLNGQSSSNEASRPSSRQCCTFVAVVWLCLFCYGEKAKSKQRDRKTQRDLPHPDTLTPYTYLLPRELPLWWHDALLCVGGLNF